MDDEDTVKSKLTLDPPDVIKKKEKKKKKLPQRSAEGVGLLVDIGQTSGFRYECPPEENIFAGRKGRPLKTTPFFKHNGSVRTTFARENERQLDDSELLGVRHFEMKGAEEIRQMAVSHPSKFLKIPSLVNEDDRDINKKLKIVTGPALGYVNALVEAQQTRNASQSNLNHLRKYKNGTAPLEKLAMLEKDLEESVQLKKEKDDVYSNTKTLSRKEYAAIQKQIYPERIKSPTRNMQRVLSPGKDSSLSDVDTCDGSEFTNKNSSITITVPHRSSISILEEENVLLSDRGGYDDTGHHTRNTKVQKKSRPEESNNKQESSYTLNAFSKNTIPVRQRKGLRSLSKDPSKLINQLPRACTGEYLVKDYAKGKYDHLFVFNHDDILHNKSDEHSCFQLTKDRLMSKKDKVYLNSEEEAEENENAQMDEMMSPSANISIECSSGHGQEESICSMPSRHSTGYENSMERIPTGTGKQRKIPGFIRTMARKKEELTHRVLCFVCSKDACYWCVECYQSYCAQCWGAVDHHESVMPDEVWQNRVPSNTIEHKPNDETGMHVYLRPSAVCQGKLPKHETKTPLQSSRPSSPPLEKIDFPPQIEPNNNDITLHTEDQDAVPTRLTVELPKEKIGPEMEVSPPKTRTPPGHSTPLSPEAGRLLSRMSTTLDTTPASSPRSLHSSNVQYSSPVAEPKVFEACIMEEAPKQTLLWQVAPKGLSTLLCPVSSLTPGKHMKQARGITKEIFPSDWEEDRDKIHREFKVFNGVAVATRPSNGAK